MAVYDGTVKVPVTHDYKFEKPFFFDGITEDEYIVEQCYYHAWIASKNKIEYKPLRNQLIDGDIQNVPDEYKISCFDPDNCTAFAELIKVL